MAGVGTAEQIVAHDDHGDAGRPGVFLRPGIDHAELRDVDRLRQERRRHIGHQRYVAGVRRVGKLDALDGFVGRVVDERRLCAQVPFGARRDRREAVGFRRGGDPCFAVFGAFSDRFLAPVAGHDIVGDRLVVDRLSHQIHRRAGELAGRPALDEQHAVVVGHVEQGLQVFGGALGDRDERLAAVAHFHDRHARALPVQHFGLGLLEHLDRQRRRARAEVIHTCHGCIPGSA